jgi:alginate O-acetyltransferase complex protein AlgI
MLFNSIPFLIFLFISITIYYIVPKKWQNVVLLVASYYFYFSAKAEYLVLLLASTFINYLTVYLFEKYEKSKSLLLILNLIYNLGILFSFKYLNFFSTQFNIIFQSVSIPIHIPTSHWILPIGISFYTFMVMGYVLDIYWGDRKRDRNYLDFSLYVAFFPQIMCGPIGRGKELMPQIQNKRSLEYNDFSNGFRLILWGFFKKIVVADNLAVYVDAVYNNAPMHSTLSIIIATFFYAFQLYADFSGYTDIARGVARLFGIKLMVNFRTPYVNSKSVSDFWFRNHISLTSWLRDYVFYPFIGDDTSKLKIYAGITLMFLLSGIWHGAGWTFIFWGIIQAFFLIAEDITHYNTKKKLTPPILHLRRLLTFISVCFGLTFFRSTNLNMLKDIFHSIMKFNWTLYTGSNSLFVFIIAGLSILIIFDYFMDKLQFDEFINQKTPILRWSLYTSLSLLIILIGNIDGKAFIYFKF